MSYDAMDNLPELSPDLRLVVNMESMLARGARYNMRGYARTDLVDSPSADTFDPFIRIERFLTGVAFKDAHYDIRSITPGTDTERPIKNITTILRLVNGRLHVPFASKEDLVGPAYIPATELEIIGITDWLDPAKLCARVPNKRKHAQAFMNRQPLALSRLGSSSLFGFRFQIGNENRER